MTEATQVHGVLDSHGERAARCKRSMSMKRPCGCGIGSMLWRSSCWRRRAISSPRPAVDAGRGERQFPHGYIASRISPRAMCWRSVCSGASIGLRRQRYARQIFTLPLWTESGSGASSMSCVGICFWSAAAKIRRTQSARAFFHVLLHAAADLHGGDGFALYSEARASIAGNTGCSAGCSRSAEQSGRPHLHHLGMWELSSSSLFTSTPPCERISCRARV